jgi:hypothetical protein
MLTKRDLQDISQVVSESIQTQVPPLINHAIQTQVPPLINHAIQTQVPPLIRKEISPIKRTLSKLKKDTTYIINALDRDLMSTAKRVDRIEKELHLSPL